MKIVIIGGGAAGVFAALTAKQENPLADVLLLERSAKLLSKVKISGGGRCNVTHSCFEPRDLVRHYPRGHKELLGPFHTFQPRDTVEWFETRGVKLKTEKDGRMFPISDSSQTIIDCLLNEAAKLGVKIEKQKFETLEEGFLINGSIKADKVILATGSAPIGWRIAEQFGHTIQPPVPSLFTFNVPDFPLKNLAGVSVENARLKIKGTKFEQEGPLLITHWGFSGPAALKLSAWAARHLAKKDYTVTLQIDWEEPLPKRLRKVVGERESYEVRGKTTNKAEFVTCGGITLSEVNFKTMESKHCKGLYFCGEILDIDGVTGGFNFQNAWTTGRIAGASL